MLLATLAVLFGGALLLWSADRFVAGSASAAGHLGMPPLLIGMVIVGFGTSAPEMIVSAQAALNGNPGIALGNAYGSNTANIGVILGLAALISPILVHSTILRKELPILTAVTALAAWQLWDGDVTRFEAIVLLAVFAALMAWSVWEGMRKKGDALASEFEAELKEHAMTMKLSIVWMVFGLVLLIISSRFLVWGAVEIAHYFKVSDLVIGLTIIAIGTSLPELASSIVAARKGEHDIALGNVLGSNLFNTLAVVGIAGTIHPMSVGPEVFNRDILTMAIFTLSLFFVCYGFRGQGRVNRVEAALLLVGYIVYVGYLIGTAAPATPAELADNSVELGAASIDEPIPAPATSFAPASPAVVPTER